MTSYYNEIDPKAAEWLRQLIRDGQIPAGDVDERDIRDIRPSDIDGYTQCHFFAGIGGWPLALRLAGWPADRPVWTGSCPCQPFSAAGKRCGTTDERHLWPHWFHLIDICRPASVFGEQVASKDGLAWLDLVSADLEGSGYAIGASDLCAAGVGAPHIRQRLFFGAYDLRSAASSLGDTSSAGSFSGSLKRIHRREEGPRAWDGEPERSGGAGVLQHPSRDGRQERWAEPSGRGVAGGCGAGELGYGISAGLEGHGGDGHRARGRAFRAGSVAEAGASGLMADGDGRNPCAEWEQRGGQYGQQQEDGEFAGRIERPGPTNGFWRDADWLLCRDDKWRPVESGTFPLASGVPGRVGLLRGYGNAIVPQVAAEFVQAFEEARVMPAPKQEADLPLFGEATP